MSELTAFSAKHFLPPLEPLEEGHSLVMQREVPALVVEFELQA